MRDVQVISYTKEWTKMFEQEVLKFLKIIAENHVTMFHIGSTSVPDLAGRRFMCKGGENPSHHIHAYQYGRLKLFLAANYSNNINAYMDGWHK